jgi:hypothetical protein
MSRTYENDPLNYSGYENRKYMNELLQLAFTKPSTYYRLQGDVLNKILEEHIKDMYKTIYNTLKSGKDKDGLPTVELITADYKEYYDITKMPAWNPRIPDQKCDEIAREIVKDFQTSIEKRVIDLVLPRNIFDDALQRSAKKAAAGIDTT